MFSCKNSENVSQKKRRKTQKQQESINTAVGQRPPSCSNECGWSDGLGKCNHVSEHSKWTQNRGKTERTFASTQLCEVSTNEFSSEQQSRPFDDFELMLEERRNFVAVTHRNKVFGRKATRQNASANVKTQDKIHSAKTRRKARSKD